jgi:hypothetical protein
MMKTRFLLFGAFLFILSACTLTVTTQSAQIATPASEILPTPEQNLPPAETPVSASGTTTYTDEFAGFSLDYPTNWFLESSALIHAQESVGYNISIASWDILNPPTPTGKDLNTLPPGGTKIDVAVTKQSMTLEEAVTQQGQNETGNPILARKDVTLANGLPGVIIDMEGFAGLTRTLITVLNGNVIYVSGYGNLENFETIALTLRPK